MQIHKDEDCLHSARNGLQRPSCDTCSSEEMKAYGCKGFGRYDVTDTAESLRASGGDNGGGSETIIYGRKR